MLAPNQTRVPARYKIWNQFACVSYLHNLRIKFLKLSIFLASCRTGKQIDRLWLDFRSITRTSLTHISSGKNLVLNSLANNCNIDLCALKTPNCMWATEHYPLSFRMAKLPFPLCETVEASHEEAKQCETKRNKLKQNAERWTNK